MNLWYNNSLCDIIENACDIIAVFLLKVNQLKSTETFMTFKKINENTIRCVLTQEDMEENDIGLEDFFSNDREKVHEFLETIMEEARREVGYENEGTMLSMQLMPLPGNGLAITITGTKENDFNEMLGNVRSMLQSLQESLGGGADTEDDLGLEHKDDFAGMLNGSAPEKVCEVQSPTTMMVEFDSMHMVEQYCESVSGISNLKSSLYKNPDGKYMLELSKGRASKASFYRACMSSREYGTPLADNPYMQQYVREHGECLMNKKVIEYIGK
jgi:adapter protein MecA 1/2